MTSLLCNTIVHITNSVPQTNSIVVQLMYYCYIITSALSQSLYMVNIHCSVLTNVLDLNEPWKVPSFEW